MHEQTGCAGRNLLRDHGKVLEERSKWVDELRVKILRLEVGEGASQPCRIRESSPGSGTCLWGSSEAGEGLACSGNKRTRACARGPAGCGESRGRDAGRGQLSPPIEGHSQEAGHDLK